MSTSTDFESALYDRDVVDVCLSCTLKECKPDSCGIIQMQRMIIDCKKNEKSKNDKMPLFKAIMISNEIFSKKYTDEEKDYAINIVVKNENFLRVKKQAFRDICVYLLNKGDVNENTV